MSERDDNVRTDPGRGRRTNVPEVVFARFKDDRSLLGAIDSLLAKEPVLVTKCLPRQQELICGTYGDKVLRMDEISGTAVISEGPLPAERSGRVAVLVAGTSDYYVSEEASISAEFFGMEVFRHYDCGVAGMHRVKEACRVVEDNDADCVIVVAGMEGALPSVIAGSVKQPVIAVPTSVGYGASFEGLAALLGMLNSCAPGIAVVNIDNGFGAAAFAHKTVMWLKGAGEEQNGVEGG